MINSIHTPVLNILFFVIAAVISFLSLNLVLRTRLTTYFCDKPDPRKVQSWPIPRLGGVAVILTFISLFVITILLQELNIISLNFHRGIIGAILLTTIAIFVCGFFDDTPFITVRARHKIATELLVAFGTVYLFNINFGEINFFNLFSFPLWLSNIISVFWILGLTNAFNIIDGIDGLVGGLSSIALMTLAVLSYWGGDTSVLIICCILAGAVTGFLQFNISPARTFMGDTGSLFLGSIIAIISMFLGREFSPDRSIIMMPLIAGVPIIEVLVTMVRRYFRAKDQKLPVFSRLRSMAIPDNSHMHHRLIYRGFSHMETSMMLCVISFTLSAGALCIYRVQLHWLLPILLYLMIPIAYTLDRLGFGGRFKKALHLSQTRYNGYKKRPLVGVIDSEGAISHILKDSWFDGVEYINITEEELDVVGPHLRAVVMQKKHTTESTFLTKAENISKMVNGPVFYVSEPSTKGLSILEVFKNGSLNVTEKHGSVQKLIESMKKVSSSTYYNHTTFHKTEEPALTRQ